MTQKELVRSRQMSLRLRSEPSIRLSPEAESELIVALAALLRAAAVHDQAPDEPEDIRRNRK